MLKYMLDTDIVIYTIKKKSAEVREAFKAHYGQICTSTITLMELVYGAEMKEKKKRKKKRGQDLN